MITERRYDFGFLRTYKENVQSTSRSEKYDYDGLGRLTRAQHGRLQGTSANGFTGITSSQTRRQDWTLSQTGNWTGFKSDAGDDGPAEP